MITYVAYLAILFISALILSRLLHNLEKTFQDPFFWGAIVIIALMVYAVTVTWRDMDRLRLLWFKITA